MNAARAHAVPGGRSAIRQPERPPIPQDAQPDGEPVAEVATRPANEAARTPVAEVVASNADQPDGRVESRGVGKGTGQRVGKGASKVASRRSGPRAARRGGRVGGEEVGGLPRRTRVMRVQLNTKMEVHLLEELRQYADDRDSTIQDVIETAVRAYMDRYPVRDDEEDEDE